VSLIILGIWTTLLVLMGSYGKGFEKNAEGRSRHQVYYGDQPARYNEFRW
jgi:recombining binding protein (suppressor of hairless)